MMKQSILIVTVMAMLLVKTISLQAQSQEVVKGIAADSVRMERDGRYLSVSMDLDLSSLAVESNGAVLLTPRLVNGTDSIELPAVGIYGRKRYYYYVRNGKSLLSGKGETVYRASRKPGHADYRQVLLYEAWMDGADLSLRREDFGCCNSLLREQDGFLGHHAEAFFPEWVYVKPETDRVKSSELEGSAFIDFLVNQTDIRPDYRHNASELGKICATIDSVRNDADITLTSVWLKGYASPEGSYRHNAELAMGRTRALRDYIQGLYPFDDKLLSTEQEPEDWAGLRRYVECSNLLHRTEILAWIDGPLEPDAKEAKIKASYPAEYRTLLADCYPALRRTDYKVAYTIRSYSDVEEIRRILQTHPQKLSLEELYLVAQDYEPGTEEFTEVFETAVRLFPNDETANLNAANAAMQRKDFPAAERYLAKAGDSAEAVYARGALAVCREDYPAACRYLAEAKARGMEQATVVLERLERDGQGEIKTRNKDSMKK